MNFFEKLRSIAIPLAFLFATALGFGFVAADDPILTRLLAYNKHMENHHLEKIHLHTNQPFYNGSDTIWFKAYVLNSFFNRPSVAGKMLNVELTDSNGAVIFRTRLRSAAGLAWGNIPLADTLEAGTYHLRAFTPGMRTFGEAFYYDKRIQVKKTPDKPQVTSAATNSIEFFPEGGDFIAGIRAKLAFKAISSNGLGIDATGTIVNDAGELITEFKSENRGMGVLAITAQPGRSYFAQVRFKDGTEIKKLIPTAKIQGYAMAVQSAGDSVRVRIFCSPELKEKGKLSLIGMQDGINKYVSNFQVKQDLQNTIWVSRELFNSGTVQFTLFDPENIPVAERLIFINKQDQLQIHTSFKGQYRQRELVDVLLDLKDATGQSQIGNLSVSVYNESELSGNDDDEASIFSDLLLTPDLKGFIESPHYYFSDPADELRARHLDHLLLTQGWRKFSWKNVLATSFPVIATEQDSGIDLAGRMTLPSGKPYVAGQVSLFKAGVSPTVLQATTDEKGQFKFVDLDILDTARFVISANNPNYRKNMKIELFNQEGLKVNVENSPPFNTAPITSIPQNSRLNQLKYPVKGILLNSVSIEAKRARKVISSANLNGPGMADAVLTADDMQNQHDLSVFLTNRVNGLKLYEGKVYARDTPDKLMAEGPQPMLVVLDGISLTQDNFELGSINADGIESVEVLKGAATTGLYGIEGAYGILVITTKRGRDRDGNSFLARTPGIRPVNLTGYQSGRVFYSPQYSPENSQAGSSDLRRAVYWNPNLTVGLAKQTGIRYFNSDYIGSYKVVIEGINAEGQMGRTIYRYKVAER